MHLLILAFTTLAIAVIAVIPLSHASNVESTSKHRIHELYKLSNCSFYIVDAYPLGWHERITLAALQGIVNRDGPILYVSHTKNDEELAVSIYVHVLGCRAKILPSNVTRLVEFFKDKVRGLIVYDPKVPGSIDVAISYAGILNALPVSPSLLDRLEKIGLKVVLDLRGRFPDNISAYEYLVNHTSIFNMSSVVVLTPGATALVDYAVKHRHVVVRLSPLPSKPVQRSLLEKFLSKVNGTILLGFFPDGGAGEYYGVRLASKYGLNLIVSSDAPSLSFSEWYSTIIGKLVRELAAKQVTSNSGAVITFDPKRVYVALIVSDGDNIAYLMNSMFSGERWNNSLRGSIPLAWTINPYTLLLAPHIPLYYYLTKTGNDTLVAGVSGAGYYAPCIVPRDRLSRLARIDKILAESLNFKYAVFITPLPCKLIGKYYAHYEAVVILSNPEAGVRGFSRCGNTTVVYAIPVRYNNYKKVVDKLLGVKARPLALVLYIDAWSFTLPRIVELVSYLRSKGAVVVPLPSLMRVLESYPELFTLGWCCLPRVAESVLSTSPDGRYVLIYDAYSGSLEALSRVDPPMLISEGSFLNAEIENVTVANEGKLVTAVIRAGPLTIKKLYHAEGCVVKVAVSVKNEGNGFANIRLLDVILDHLDTLIWPRTGYGEESPCTVGPRYYSPIGSKIVEYRRLGVDPQVLCGECNGVVVFDTSEPAGGIAVVVNASGEYIRGYRLLDAFSDGDYDRDGLGEIHTVTLDVKLNVPPGGQASYEFIIIPVGHTWLIRVPAADPRTFTDYPLRPILQACMGERSLSIVLSACCPRTVVARSCKVEAPTTTTITRTVTKIVAETVTETVERTVFRTVIVTVYKTPPTAESSTATTETKLEKASSASMSAAEGLSSASKRVEGGASGRGECEGLYATTLTDRLHPRGRAGAYYVLAAALLAGSALAFIALRSLFRHKPG